MGGIVPGNLGSSAGAAPPDRLGRRSRAHSSFAVAWAESSRARSTTGRSVNGSVIRTSLTRTGTRCRCVPVASAAEMAFQAALASGECRYAEDRTAMVRETASSSRSAWMPLAARAPDVVTVLCGRTRNPARVRTASIQSAHIRSSGA